MYSSVNYRYYILCDNRKFIPAGNRTDGAQGKSPANFHLLRLLRKVQDKKAVSGFFPRRDISARERNTDTAHIFSYTLL